MIREEDYEGYIDDVADLAIAAAGITLLIVVGFLMWVLM